MRANHETTNIPCPGAPACSRVSSGAPAAQASEHSCCLQKGVATNRVRKRRRTEQARKKKEEAQEENQRNTPIRERLVRLGWDSKKRTRAGSMSLVRPLPAHATEKSAHMKQKGREEKRRQTGQVQGGDASVVVHAAENICQVHIPRKVACGGRGRREVGEGRKLTKEEGEESRANGNSPDRFRVWSDCEVPIKAK